MGIVDEDIVRVREATDIVALVSEHLALRRVGTRWVGLCPFHGEKTPSFSVNAEAGLYYCFGCQAKGDAITFVREIEHLDFAAAVEALAGRAGVTLRYTDAHEGEGRRRRRQLGELVAKAADWYHDRLLTGADAGPARAYLRARGLDGEEVRRYRIGWAPDRFDELCRALRASDAELVDTGLGFVNRAGRQQDFFRARVLFPIFDVQGDPVGFGGRKLPGADGPKYRNSPDRELYHKSRVLYGLNWAKTDAVNAGEVIVCEGYTDVIGFAAAGLPRAVATCGTALTEDHVRLLRRFARRLLLAFDPDTAGQAAADRVYAWERAHDLDVAVVELPSGQDPADVARRDPAALRAAVADARPFLGFRVNRVLAAADLSTPEGRARAAEASVAVIAEHPSELVRDPYLMEVADRCRVDVGRLRELVRAPRARPAPQPEGAPTDRPRRAPRDTPAAEVLRLAVHRFGDLPPAVAPELFSDPVDREVFTALQGSGGEIHAALAGVSPEAASLLTRLALQDSDAEPLDVVARLVDTEAARAIGGLEREARGSPDPLAYSAILGWVKVQAERLRADPEAELSGEAPLVAWLVQRVGEKE